MIRKAQAGETKRAPLPEQRSPSKSNLSKSPNESIEIFRGSSDIDLSAQGLQEARDAAKRTSGQFTEIHASPLKRAQDTAKEIIQTNRQVKDLHTETALEPWFLGQHEGQPVTPERISDICDRIKNKPDEAVPGRGARSTGDGESFNAFKNPLIELVIEEIAFFRPGDRILNITHYRDVQAIKAWLKNGAKDDLSIDTKLMTEKGDQKPGDLYRLNPQNMELEETNDAGKDGIYFLRHGATQWNAENNGPSPNRVLSKDLISKIRSARDLRSVMAIYDSASDDSKKLIHREVRNKIFSARQRPVEFGKQGSETWMLVRKYFPTALPRPAARSVAGLQYIGSPNPIQ